MKIEIPDDVHCWHMDKMSSASELGSVVLHTRRFLTESEIETIRRYLVGGCCYRFRIGKDRYYFGDTPQEAITLAVRARDGDFQVAERGTGDAT